MAPTELTTNAFLSHEQKLIESKQKASLFSPLVAIFQPLFAIIFKVEIFWLPITEMITYNPGEQRFANKLTKGRLLLWVNECVQQPGKQQVGVAGEEWRRKNFSKGQLWMTSQSSFS